MMFQVEWGDINNAEINVADNCPLARAISRRVGRPVAVFEDGWVETDSEPSSPVGQLSQDAVRAIAQWDTYGLMQPGEYELLQEEA